MTHQICQGSLRARMAWGHLSQQTTLEVLLVGRALLLNGELAPHCPMWPQATLREDETKYIPPNFEVSGSLPFLQKNWRKKYLTQTSCLILGGTLYTKLLFSLVPELMLILEQRHLSQENFHHILHISATNCNTEEVMFFRWLCSIIHFSSESFKKKVASGGTQRFPSNSEPSWPSYLFTLFPQCSLL